MWVVGLWLRVWCPDFEVLEGVEGFMVWCPDKKVLGFGLCGLGDRGPRYG
jgi:hypothetical protein